MKKRAWGISAGLCLALSVSCLSGCAQKTVESGAETRNEAGQDVESETQTSEERSEQTEETQKQTEADFKADFFPIRIADEVRQEWGERSCLLEGRAQKLYFLDTDSEHTALKKVFERYNKEEQEELDWFFHQNLSDAQAYFQERSDDAYDGWMYHSDVEVTRADERVFSFKTQYEEYTGGAHGFYSTVGHNYDTASGRTLSLRDIAADYDGIYEYVCTYLESCNEDGWLYEGYEEVVKSLFYEEQKDNPENGVLSWYFTDDGITVHFDHYVLSYYAAGSIDVEVPYRESGLFLPEYILEKSSWVIPMSEYVEVSADVDGNGEKEAISYSIDRSMYEGYGPITVTCAGLSLSTEAVNTEDYYVNGGYDSNGYLIHTAGGKTFLYLEHLVEDDARYLTIFDLSDGVPRYVGGSDGGFYEYPVMTPEAFILFERFDVLGTYRAYQICHVGADGIPESEETAYRLAYSSANPEEYRVTLTSVRELDVTMLEENGNEGAEETLVSGTVYTIIATDGASYADAELDDGRRCRMYLEKSDKGWGWSVNGVDEDECFEFVPYAG